MSVQVDAGDVVAGLALIIAIYSTWITARFNRRQTAFEETNERLNLMLIEKEAAETKAQKAADLSANFYKAGKNDYRLKIFNRGKGVARNVKFEVLDDSDLFMDQDITGKFPMPIMEQQSSVELIGCVDMGSPSRVHIRLTWDDDAGGNHQKELHPAW
jgi:hypothetical protein